MAINLQKGQKINLSKESRGGLNKVMVGLGWDEVPQKRGFFAPKPQDIDCDAFAILLGYDGKLLNHANEVKQCTVFFNNLVQMCIRDRLILPEVSTTKKSTLVLLGTSTTSS